MRAIPLAACLLPLAPALVQAALPDKVEQAFAQYNELPALLTPVLEEAKDKESAEAAAPRLHALLPKVYDARTALQDVRLTPEMQEELRRKYGRKMQEEWGQIYQHIFRLQKTRCYNSLAFFKQFHTLCLMLDQ